MVSDVFPATPRRTRRSFGMLSTLVERTLKGREDGKKNKNLIFRGALQSYAVYGSVNPFKHELKANELNALKAEELVNWIHRLTSYEHKIWYWGPQDLTQLTKVLNKEHHLPKVALSYPPAVVFTRVETRENKVLFVDYSMVQAEIMWLNKSTIGYDASKAPIITLFNEYFGGGMSSIVFQTIRESKALAYSTSSRYITPNKQKDPYYINAYVGCQADKFNEAVPAMNDLINNMPQAANNFESAKTSLMNGIETQRTNDQGIIFAYASAQKLGLDKDINREIYTKLPAITMAELNQFQTETYKNKPFTYCILGSKDKLLLTDMEKIGKVQVLTLEEIFGY